MKTLKKIIIHCSATPNFNHFDAFDIDEWHKKRGWKGCGYHKVFLLNGEVQDHANSPCRKPDQQGAHTGGLNENSWGWCLIGTDSFDAAQIDQLYEHLIEACIFHNLSEKDVFGHNEFANKRCPGFDIRIIRSGLERAIHFQKVLRRLKLQMV